MCVYKYIYIHTYIFVKGLLAFNYVILKQKESPTLNHCKAGTLGMGCKAAREMWGEDRWGKGDGVDGHRAVKHRGEAT